MAPLPRVEGRDRAILKWPPHVGGGTRGIAELLGHHPDDEIRLAVEQHPLADDPGAAAAESASNQPIAQDHHVRSAGNALAHEEVATYRWRYAEHAQVRCTHTLPLESLGLGGPRNRGLPSISDGKRGKRSASRLKLDKGP